MRFVYILIFKKCPFYLKDVIKGFFTIVLLVIVLVVDILENATPDAILKHRTA